MTDKKTEALKLALEALTHFEKAGLATLKTVDAITAIREALAEQPAQQQEPVAWITKNGKGWLRWHKPEDSEKNKDSIPLYTAPTSKPWVGLTQTDLVDCDEEELKQARYWENKLKEKNT